MSPGSARIEEMSVEDVADIFRPCVSPYGVSEEVHKLKLPAAPDLAGTEYLDFPASSLIADGFIHTLVLRRREGEAYIYETGGFAGVRNWYGPLSVRIKCGKGALRG